MAIRAVIFDWDGVIVDSSDMILQTYNHLYKKGMSSLFFKTKKEFLEFFDTNWLNNAPKMGLDTEEKIETAITEYRRYFQTLLEQPPLVGEKMKRVIKDLNAEELLLGIASNMECKSIIIPILEENGLVGVFGSVIGHLQAGKLKPHPAGLQVCMKELGVAPEETVFIGDSRNDIIAGKNANVAATIGVCWGLAKREILASEQPDYLVEIPDELHKVLDNVRAKYH